MKNFALFVLALGALAGSGEVAAQQGPTMTVCAGPQFVPNGWIKINDTTVPQTTCAAPTPNAWIVEKYADRWLNATIMACNGPVPAGWTKLRTITSNSQCVQPYPGNVMEIKHTSCDNQSPETCYPSWVSVSPFQVKVPYGTQWGSTQVTWSAPAYPGACIWVTWPGASAPQQWGCSGTSGNATWPYVAVGTPNTFFLTPSASQTTPVLAQNTVTAVYGTKPTISASPTVVNIPAGQTNGTTTISYNLSGSGHGAICVWVQNTGGSAIPQHCAVGTSGTFTWQWVPKGGSSTFWLNNSSTSPADVYATVTVHGQ